jgi:hypothetical protein
MSEPKRYEYVSDGYTARFINPKTGHAAPCGEYVRCEDYARLKAEVERLKEDNRQLTNAFEIAEGIIKRMGKAAEAAAKEGKPSV